MRVIWVHVDQTYFMGYGIPAIVDDTNLHSTRMAKADVEQTYLREPLRVSAKVVTAHLHTAHIGGTYVGATVLQASLHTHGDIRESTNCSRRGRRTGYIIK